MSQDSQAPLQFAQLGLSEPVMQAVTAIGYETPSPIQAATIPAMLEGRDVLARPRPVPARPPPLHCRYCPTSTCSRSSPRP